MFFDHFNFAFMSTFEFKVVPAEGLFQEYFLRSFGSLQGQNLIDFQFYKKEKKVLSCTFLCEGGRAESLPMAPFGGVWSHREIDQPEVLSSFLEHIFSYLQQYQIRLIRVIQPPQVYESYSELVNNLLFKNGFTVQAVLSHQFLRGKKNIRNFFKTQSSRWEEKLNDKQLNLTISSINNFGFLKDIQQWNSQKGYGSNWTEERLIQQVSLFPDRYFKISVSHKEFPQAHAVGVKLTDQVLYYFLSANKPESPFKNLGEFLLFGLIKLGKEEKVDAIDLGSSEVDGEINSNLMYFKSRFSNEIGNKFIWERKL